MDKEAIEKIALLHYCEYMGWDYRNVKEREKLFKSSDDMKREMYVRAERTLKLIEELGYRKLPQAKPPLLSVPDHSESIWCPHCGEEFGIESNIEYAHEAQREADIVFYATEKPPFSAGYVDE